MNIQLLIDGIVRQTTVLIAQLATSGGVRAPLAGIANQVFLDLTSELEAQGISRKVSADMFGMALRAYQRKIQRLRESSTEQGLSLWEAVFRFIKERGLVSRREVVLRFSRDEETQIGSVLHDLTESGLVFRSGSGWTATFRAATDEELGRMSQLSEEGTDELVWVLIYREGPLSAGELAQLSRLGKDAFDAALRRLVEAGRVQRSGDDAEPVYSSAEFVVPRGQSVGWEAAVFDHYQAVVRTVCSRLQTGGSNASGSTYTLDVWRGHPLEEEVMSILESFRDRIGELRNRVETYNAEHGLPAEHAQVVVYAGQCVLSKEASR